MGFPQVAKYTAVILLILGIIGSFYLAKELSTSAQLVPKYEYITSDKMELREVKNDAVYNIVLYSTWISSLILCLFLYGIGVVVEELRQGNTHNLNILRNTKENRNKDNE